LAALRKQYPLVQIVKLALREAAMEI